MDGQATRSGIPIGKRIESLLSDLGMSPSSLAEKAGLDRSTISRIIKGERNPTPETLSNLAPVLGLSLEQLVLGTDAAGRVDEAANLVSRAHYEEAIHQVIAFERKTNELQAQLRTMKELLQSEEARRQGAEMNLAIAQQERDQALLAADRHEKAAARYQTALEQAVADMARLETQVGELGQAVDRSRLTGHVAAILAGTAAVASVATYLSRSASQTPPEAKARPEPKEDDA